MCVCVYVCVCVCLVLFSNIKKIEYYKLLCNFLT